MILMVMVLGVHLVFGIRRGDMVLKYMFIFNVILILGSYFIRHFTY
jgi:type IV secretory pathway VirB2 component (pilin)